ncbi:unnamed protein product [Ceutorhynchus assimilis]|uniref:non-specific serine/threonine protein kinase n=1 Tax=Ceutorhynchus assimilis TaxID=467358 RepID=A0A9N9N163_9CUCU|nr:unnamed protein product [Ceutorhynchus assimilis]
MAPSKKFKTYSRGRNISISSAQAVDILFASNLTKRKLHGKNKKNRFEVKELQTKIKTILQDEASLHVNVNDTFDTVFKQQKLNNLKSTNASNATSSFFTKSHSSHYVSVASPMVKKLRSFSKQSQNNNSSNILDSWFEKPTPPGAGITNSLEIEVASGKWKVNNNNSVFESPKRMLRSNSTISSTKEASTNNSFKFAKTSQIMLRSCSKSQDNIPQASLDNISLPINQLFTNSVRGRIHSSTPLSTPVVPAKTKKIFPQPINEDPVSECILQSLEEIQSWNTSLTTVTSNSKPVVNKSEYTQPMVLATSCDFVFEQFFSTSIQQNSYPTRYEENLTMNESSILSTTSPRQTNNFITYRRRRKTQFVQKKKEQSKELVVLLEKQNSLKPFKKQLVVRLQRLPLSAIKPKISLRNSHFNNNSQGASMMNHSHMELSVFVEESKTSGSFNQSSQIIINAKESSVLRRLGFEDVSEKENEPSSTRTTRSAKRKSLRNSSSLDTSSLDTSSQTKRYLRSSLTENSNRPSTSTTVDNNISEDLFTSGDFSNKSAQLRLSLYRTSKTEFSSISLKNSTKSSITSFSYNDSREQSQITQYCGDLDDQSSNLKAGSSYNMIVIDASRDDETSVFKMPLAPSNSQPVKTGKSWRRSSFNNKSLFDITKRQSMKIVPSDEADSRQLRRPTILQNYIGSIGVSRKSLVTAKDIVFKYCNQTNPLPFEMLYPKSLLEGSKKIGEGVYGEVFLCPKENGKSTVMKIIPIEGDKIINGEKQKMFDEILSEVVIVSQLSNLRNTSSNKTSAFCEVQQISCVIGKYPETLLELWHQYDKAKGSENDPPDIFDKDQLYIVLELGNAGQDLEAYVFQNAAQSLAMFKQIAFALAVAEEQLQFEHRDLHWGNVLLQPIEKDKKATFKLKGKAKSLASEGVEATIIDFTLSRVLHDGVIIFNDLSCDPDLFIAKGDYQFDIYRLMKQKNKNDWKSFTPYSNILWLHYILKKSMTELRYKKPSTKVHAKNIQLLKKFEGVILKFNSVTEFVTANL